MDLWPGGYLYEAGIASPRLFAVVLHPLSAAQPRRQNPHQMHQGWPIVPLTAPLYPLRPQELLLTSGRINFIRNVDAMGRVRVLSERWFVGFKWMSQYVWVGVHTANQILTLWHKPEAQAPWQHIKTCPYRLHQSVYPLLPDFRRNHLRCREH